MDIEFLRQLAGKWGDANRSRIKHCPPEAKFISGEPQRDAMLHYFEQESGIELKLAEKFTKIVGYDVIDEQKCFWFMMRWS